MGRGPAVNVSDRFLDERSVAAKKRSSENRSSGGVELTNDVTANPTKLLRVPCKASIKLSKSETYGTTRHLLKKKSSSLLSMEIFKITKHSRNPLPMPSMHTYPTFLQKAVQWSGNDRGGRGAPNTTLARTTASGECFQKWIYSSELSA